MNQDTITGATITSLTPRMQSNSATSLQVRILSHPAKAFHVFSNAATL